MKIMGKIKEKVKLALGQESYFSGQLYKQLQTYADFLIWNNLYSSFKKTKTSVQPKLFDAHRKSHSFVISESLFPTLVMFMS